LFDIQPSLFAIERDPILPILGLRVEWNARDLAEGGISWRDALCYFVDVGLDVIKPLVDMLKEGIV